MKNIRLSRGRATWATVVGLLALVTVLTAFGPWSEHSWEQPSALFTIQLVAAVVCVFGATAIIALADRRDSAEVGLLGTALMASSVMPLVHGLVTPGVLYDDTAAFHTSSFLTLPVAVLVAAPLLTPHSGFGRWSSRHWRDWTLLALIGVFVLASVVVFFPDAIVAPAPHEPSTLAIAAGAAVAMLLLSLRQVRFHELGGHPSNLVAALSVAALSVTAFLPVTTVSYSPGFWWLHVAGAIGVVGACVGLAVARRLSPTAREVLAPVLVRDPLVAFELGLSPTVHRFVADLEEQDEQTRDHVVRTGELAMRVGERLHITGRQLRDLGLAAMLHDVGKLNVPDEVLTKPARLTEDEYEVMKLHPVYSERMLRSEPTLAGAADIVRSHHERMDGSGYPDGLVGSEIPLAARIISACDAMDAMTHDRPWRPAMPVKLAFAVLREHAGLQWDPEVVRHVVAVLPSMPTVSTFDEVGRHIDEAELAAAIPADVTELLAAVDAEI